MSYQRALSHHPGEDSQTTTIKELWGWYSYGLAAEVFAVCGVGSFLPVTLEQLAREIGMLRSDRTIPCIQHSSAVVAERALLKRDDDQCVIRILGTDVDTSSFALYTFSLAVLTQSLVLVSIGTVADYGENRKKLLLAFAFVGAASCMLFIIVVPAMYLVASLLAIVSIASLGSSFVLLNSFLPLLVSNHSSIRGKSDGAAVPLSTLTSENDDMESVGSSSEVRDFSAHSLLEDQSEFKMRHLTSSASAALKLSNQISSKGVGIGYAAAVLGQIISIGILVLFSNFSPSTANSSVPMRTVLFVVGFWWALFTLPAVLWLRPRPGPPLPSRVGSGKRCFSWLSYVVFAWASIWRTVKVAAQLRQVVIFLMGWFLLSDGIATISGTAILFARTELQLSTAAVAMLSITATASGIIGAFSWPIIGRRWGLSSISIVLTCVIIYETIPLYGLLAFIPLVKGWGVIGLQQPWEIYPLAFILGFVMGGISSYCRSAFGSLIPPGSEAAFYALYAVTDKGSSVIGPAIVGRIIDVTGSIRMGFWFLSVVMILPLPFFWFVDLEQGRQDASTMAENTNLKGRLREE